jgi:hypothetical protein
MIHGFCIHDTIRLIDSPEAQEAVLAFNRAVPYKLNAAQTNVKSDGTFAVFFNRLEVDIEEDLYERVVGELLPLIGRHAYNVSTAFVDVCRGDNEEITEVYVGPPEREAEARGLRAMRVIARWEPELRPIDRHCLIHTLRVMGRFQMSPRGPTPEQVDNVAAIEHALMDAREEAGLPRPVLPWSDAEVSRKYLYVAILDDEYPFTSFWPAGSDVEGALRIWRATFGIRLARHAVGGSQPWHMTEMVVSIYGHVDFHNIPWNDAWPAYKAVFPEEFSEEERS